MPFIKLRKFPSVPSLFSVFIMKGVGFCQVLFSASIKMTVGFVLYSVIMIYYFD